MKLMPHFMKGSVGSIVINLIILVWTTLLVGWQLSQDLQWSITSLWSVDHQYLVAKIFGLRCLLKNDLHLPFHVIPKGLLEFFPNVGKVVLAMFV